MLSEALTSEEFKDMLESGVNWKLETPAMVLVTIHGREARGRTLCEAYRNLTGRTV